MKPFSLRHFLGYWQFKHSFVLWVVKLVGKAHIWLSVINPVFKLFHLEQQGVAGSACLIFSYQILLVSLVSSHCAKICRYSELSLWVQALQCTGILTRICPCHMPLQWKLRDGKNYSTNHKDIKHTLHCDFNVFLIFHSMFYFVSLCVWQIINELTDLQMPSDPHNLD